ncbi:MAG: hypothetical protein IIA44_07550 [Acidobacteria bacterium]|nr:hypothetical protein [Acidobacteriota bacterium]
MPNRQSRCCHRYTRVLWSLVVLLAPMADSRADDSIRFKVRIQPRADAGDFTTATGNGYHTQLDLYIRRSRLEIVGRPTDGVLYVLAVSGDRAGQRGASAASARVAYAFVNYQLLAPAMELRAGLVKLPFSRGALVSSSRILLIERAFNSSTAAATYGRYITPCLTLHGRLRQGRIGYSVAVMDGFQAGDSDSRFSGTTVTASDNPGFVARFEYSPGSWIEGRQSDSHLGVGRHLTVAANAALQRGIEFETGRENRLVMGGDISFHRQALSLQVEYLRVDRDGPSDLSPAGWYIQAGYYLAALKLEPALRYERFDADLPDGSDVTTVHTVGLNWYRHGHDLKFAANIVHSRFQGAVRQIDTSASRTVVQVQSQMYF